MRQSVVLVAVLCTQMTFADDACWSYFGGAGNFSRNKQIRMVSETVDLSLRDEKSHVHAAFHFRNEGPATIVTMAFPEESYDPGKPSISNFKSYVDGRAVQVRRQRLPKSAGLLGSTYVAVWLKTVSFAANQSLKVEVDYDARNGDRGDFVETGYVLRTGATWKGRIGKAVINVDWTGLEGLSEPSFRGVGGLMEPTAPRKGRIVLADFEPDTDLVADWSNAYWNFVVNGKVVEHNGFVNGLQASYGPGKDPEININHLEILFGQPPTPEDGYVDGDDTPNLPFVIGTHFVSFSKDRMIVDGTPAKLKRPIHETNGASFVYLRDLISAVGGTFKYDPAYDRVTIVVK